MAKQNWKPGNMLYPLPAVMVSCQSSTAHDPLCERPELDGKPNIITVAWAGTVCTNPPMVSISVRPERYSYHLIEESGEFVINLTTEKLVKATDYCGVRSGRDVDKFKEMHLTPLASKHIHAPGIAESPVNIECKVREIKPLGSHSMILADVVGVTIDDTLLDRKRKIRIKQKRTCHLLPRRILPARQEAWNLWIQCKKREKAKSLDFGFFSTIIFFTYSLQFHFS